MTKQKLKTTEMKAPYNVFSQEIRTVCNIQGNKVQETRRNEWEAHVNRMNEKRLPRITILLFCRQYTCPEDRQLQVEVYLVQNRQCAFLTRKKNQKIYFSFLFSLLLSYLCLSVLCRFRIFLCLTFSPIRLQISFIPVFLISSVSIIAIVLVILGLESKFDNNCWVPIKFFQNLVTIIFVFLFSERVYILY